MPNRALIKRAHPVTSRIARGKRNMKNYPKCKLINRDIAKRCACGYDFPSGTMQSSYLTATDRRRILGCTCPGELWSDPDRQRTPRDLPLSSHFRISTGTVIRPLLLVSRRVAFIHILSGKALKADRKQQQIEELPRYREKGSPLQPASPPSQCGPRSSDVESLTKSPAISSHNWECSCDTQFYRY